MNTTPLEAPETDLTQWVPLPDFLVEIQSVMTEHQVRELMRRRETNGLAGAVCRPGKNLLIHRGEFAEWMRGQK